MDKRTIKGFICKKEIVELFTTRKKDNVVFGLSWFYGLVRHRGIPKAGDEMWGVRRLR